MHRRKTSTRRLIRRDSRSNERGLLGTMVILVAIIICLAMTMMAIDVSHLVATRAQLRNAADAAAVAGAQQLSIDPSQCAKYAYDIAADNLADGIPVKDIPNRMTVTADVVPPNPGLGTVTVTVSMIADDIISPLIGRGQDVITVKAVAGGAGKVVKTYGGILFPLALSLDYVPQLKTGPGLPLSAIPTNGGQFDIYLQAQGAKNAAWTSLSSSPTTGNFVKSAVDQILKVNGPGNSNKTVSIPPVAIGDSIDLSNGMIAGQKLGNDPYATALTDGTTFILPIILGDPAYNKARQVVGFAAVQFTSFTAHAQPGVVETLHAKLISTTIPGVSGPLPTTGVKTWDTALNSMDPATVKLLE